MHKITINIWPIWPLLPNRVLYKIFCDSLGISNKWQQEKTKSVSWIVCTFYLAQKAIVVCCLPKGELRTWLVLRITTSLSVVITRSLCHSVSKFNSQSQCFYNCSCFWLAGLKACACGRDQPQSNVIFTLCSHVTGKRNLWCHIHLTLLL